MMTKTALRRAASKVVVYVLCVVVHSILADLSTVAVLLCRTASRFQYIGCRHRQAMWRSPPINQALLADVISTGARVLLTLLLLPIAVKLPV